MTDLLEGLNKQQIQAVTARPGPTLVIAGPGSGKTAVLTRRVAYLIREMDVPAYRIMAVTFTNKAAQEMQERIAGLLGERAKGLTIGTFHAICARILRREAPRLGMKSDYVIYDTDDQVAAMKQAMVESGMGEDESKGSAQPRRFLNAVSGAKNELIGPDQYPEGSHDDRIIARLYRRYQAILRQSNAMDFDDLLMQAVLLFQRNPDVLERYKGFYQHILVDEFQDTNRAQYVLVRLLAGDEGSLFCVGDPDQSIYRFRGADYRNLGYFQRDYPGAQLILLEENYRSYQIILDAAMAVIDKNEDRIQKRLRANRVGTNKLILKNLLDENDEAQYVVWTIKQYNDMGRYRYKDCAVMYRTNAQSRALEETFGRANIPYRLIGGVRFYSRREVKDLLAYLRLIQNPDDAMSLRRVINVPPRGIGKQTLARLEDWAAGRGEGLYDALRAVETAKDSPFTGRAAKSLAEFARLIERWRAIVLDTERITYVGGLVKDVIDQIAYTAYLNDNTPEGKERVENVLELYNRALNAGPKTLAEFLEEIALVSDIDNYDEAADGVVLLTLHSAKGLEFPVVFIVGLEEGIMPHQNAMSDEEQLAEERRLMYVGVTRAKDLLHLTWVTRRSFYGGLGERALASRFLTDLPPELTSGTPVPGRTPFNVERSEYRRAATWRPPAPPAAVISRPAPVRTSSLYKPGQKVRHEKFGDGLIIRSQIRGDDEEIDVKFERFGIKRLSASIAPMTLIDND